MKARHQDVVNGVINTHLGEVHVERYLVKKIVPRKPTVEGQKIKEVTHEDLVREVPGFLDVELFPAPKIDPTVDPKVYASYGVFENEAAHQAHLDMKKSEEEQAKAPVAEKITVTDEELLKLLQDLAHNKNYVNSEGYVNIDVLTKKLRAMGFEPVKGDRRKEVWDLWKKQEADEKAKSTANIPPANQTPVNTPPPGDQTKPPADGQTKSPTEGTK